jgi:hypothetical protein
MMNFRSRITAAFLLLACPGAVVPAYAGTLLPNGMQTFLDQNGAPLAGGCVYFFTPGTSSSKDTYTSADQTVANSNPVQLDAAGRAVIYGSGVYRQVVKKAGPNSATPCSPAGTQVWDQVTSDTSSTITIYAGASSGTPNAITVNAPDFSGADGQIINYISTSTNTAASTINPSGFGAVQIVRDSATGPAALTGGELVATNAVSLQYDATAGTFHILSPVNWPNSSGVPVGTTIAVSGFRAPTNYAFAQGQSVSRVTYASLFTEYTSAQSGTLTSGSAVIAGLSDTSQFGRGQYVEALGIPGGAQILSCISNACTMTVNATATRSGSITFFAYGNGDGSATFNLPDYRGYSLVGRDNMGGTPLNALQTTTSLTTTLGSATATPSSGSGLAVGMYIVGNPNIVPGATITALSGGNIIMSNVATGTQAGVATRFSVLIDAQALGINGGSFTKVLEAGELAPHTHANTLTDPGHIHSVTDPGHIHSVTDPGHVHSVADPGHIHAITDTGHIHAVTDPGHIHSVTDPGHTHGATNINGATLLSNAGGALNFAAGALSTIGATSGFTINSATTGISVNSHATGLTVNNAATGISINNAATGLTVNSGVTGVSINSGVTGVSINSGATGISINNASTGSGHAFGMIGPVRIVNWAVRLVP